jgi:hypothetical protein
MIHIQGLNDPISNLGGGITTIEQLMSHNGSGTVDADNIFGFDLSDFSDSTGVLGTMTLASSDEAITANQFVAIGGNDIVTKASATSGADAIGVATTTTGAVGIVPIEVKPGSFRLNGVLSGATAGQPFYIDPASDGDITSTAPSSSGEYVIKVGIALNADDLLVKISDPVRIA